MKRHAMMMAAGAGFVLVALCLLLGAAVGVLENDPGRESLVATTPAGDVLTINAGEPIRAFAEIPGASMDAMTPDERAIIMAAAARFWDTDPINNTRPVPWDRETGRTFTGYQMRTMDYAAMVVVSFPGDAWERMTDEQQAIWRDAFRAFSESWNARNVAYAVRPPGNM